MRRLLAKAYRTSDRFPFLILTKSQSLYDCIIYITSQKIFREIEFFVFSYLKARRKCDYLP